MQATLLFSVMSKNAFLAIISIAGSMILIPYALSAMYLLKLAFVDETASDRPKSFKLKALINGTMATIYGFWLIYAAGLHYILMSTILYSVGIFVYRKAWIDNGRKGKLYTPAEKLLAIVLVILGIGSLIFMIANLFPADEWVHFFQQHSIKRH